MKSSCTRGNSILCSSHCSLCTQLLLFAFYCLKQDENEEGKSKVEEEIANLESEVKAIVQT